MPIVKKKKTIIQLVVLIGLLIGVILLFKGSLKNNIIEKIDTVFNSRTIPVFYDSVLVDEKKRSIAGFWQRVEDRKMPEKPYSINDCIEVKENGIFWQVLKYTLWISEIDSVQIMHVLSGYILPFKADPEDSTTALVDAFVRAQAFTINQDTCYVGKETMDMQRQQNIMEMMSDVYASKIKRGEGKLKIDEKAYIKYDTTQHPLAQMFPVGAVEIVDKFSVEKCRSGYSLSSIVKREVERNLSVKNTALTENEVKKIIEIYYQPLIVNLIAKGFTSKVLQPMTGEVSVAFDIDGDGTVSEVKIIKDKLSNRYFSKRLAGEVASWRFSVKDKNANKVHIDYKFTF